MISSPDVLLWLTLAAFFVASVVSVTVAGLSYFGQKRPWLVPALILAAGVIEAAIVVMYGRIVVPGFPGGPLPSARIRLPFLLAALALLLYPILYYIMNDREFKIMMEHAAQLKAKRTATEYEKGVLQRHLDRAIDQNMEQKRQFAELRSLIITNVRHELLTPATFVLGWVKMILDGTFGEPPDPLREPLLTVHSSTSRLAAVVDRMVTTLREPSFREADMADIGRGALADAGVWLNTRRQRDEVILAADIPDHLPMVGDPEMLHAALVELLNNAVKFGSSEVELRMFVQDGEIVTQVIDNGIGISRPFHRRIFEPLFQIQMHSKRQYEGAGNGLAAVERVAVVHDGKVFVDSKLGNGAAFSFVIPGKRE